MPSAPRPRSSRSATRRRRVRGSESAREMPVTQTERKAEIRAALERTRTRTLWLLDLVPDEMFKVRVHDFYSPVGWHFGHVGMTEEYWVCKQALGRPCLNDRLSFLFANLPENPK